MALSDTLLVLGAAGFLGGQVVRAGSRGFAHVVAAGRGPGLVRFEATEPGSWRALLRELEPTAVVNAAALSRVGDCFADPDRAAALNERFPGELAGACRELGARLVHVSTDLVFGGEPPPPRGFAEDGEPAPLSVYGRSKAAGERAVLRADPGALVVRLPLLFGDASGTGRGASEAVLSAWRAGRRPSLFVDEWRTPLDVAEAAAALVELARLEVAGLLHVAGPRRLSRYELGCAILAAHGVRSPKAALEAASRADFDAPEPRPRDVSLDAGRARALLTTPLTAK